MQGWGQLHFIYYSYYYYYIFLRIAITITIKWVLKSTITPNATMSALHIIARTVSSARLQLVGLCKLATHNAKCDNTCTVKTMPAHVYGIYNDILQGCFHFHRHISLYQRLIQRHICLSMKLDGRWRQRGGVWGSMKLTYNHQ